MKNIAIIPARGGSKRIPHKNIKEFMGKPIITYSINAAIQSELFDEIMVSTDDETIAKIAIDNGAKVPFFRSEKTANDFATTDDVLKEVLNEYMKINLRFDNMCCIYATAPLIQSEELAKGYDLLNNSDFTSVYPIVPFSYTIWRCLDIDTKGNIKRHWPKYENSRSQDLPIEYHDTGTFYWHKIKEWISGNIKSGGIIVDEITVQDIDNETDWRLAEMKYKLLHNNV